MQNVAQTRPNEFPARRSLNPRIVAAMVFLPTLTLLVVSVWLTPSPLGHGTHKALGLQPCGMLAATGLPCVTCGMTTAFSHAAEGNLLQATLVQPAGAFLALVNAMAVLTSGWALLTGMSLAGIGRALWRPATVVVLGVILLASWGYTLSTAIGN